MAREVDIARAASVAELVTLFVDPRSHLEADTILCRAIELLAARLGEQELARHLLEAYAIHGGVERFYV